MSELWTFVQSTPKYGNKTLLFLTVDHGRGRGDEWTSHNSHIAGASEIWFAIMGPGISPKGAVATNVQLYQRQFAQTIATQLDLRFISEHPVAPEIELQTGK